MNFFDLCVAFCRAIGRACVALWHILERMIRLTYRYWYIVITLVLLAVGGAYYLTRYENTTFRVNAIALLNGPSIQQFEQAYAPLRSHQLLPPDAPIGKFLYSYTSTDFKTFPVIDVLGDGTADFVDFKHKIKMTDTINVHMTDRLCLQFSMKVRNMHAVPEIEETLLATLNSNEAMQRSYVSYMENLREQVAFDHRQAVKLDSLTSAYYFQNALPVKSGDNGVYFSGDRRVRLFLKEIYKQHHHAQLMDYRIQLATAPVVLENHFAVDPTPKIGRISCMIFFFCLGWIVACLIAGLIDRRKEVMAWLTA